MKMTEAREIYAYIDKIAPFDSALDFDNAGFLCGDINAAVSKALICLDITPSVAQEALKLGCELIISHHPIIFKPMRTLEADSVPYILAKNSISAICAHTNLDLSPIGTNVQLAKMLGLSAIENADGECLAFGILNGEMSPRNFAIHVKEKLGCKGLRYTSPKKTIKRVAVCTGAGGDMIYRLNGKADAFITGEIKHHELIDADKMGLAVVDIGHYRSEFIVCAPLASMLGNRFPNTEFIVSDKDVEPTEYL